jgi:hypothetical protein
MPIPVTKYRCDFKCGTKAIGDRRKMIAHEKNCLKNPETKSCMTCVNQIYERDSGDVRGTFHMRGCKLEKMEEFIQEIHESLELPDTATCHVKPLVHCPNWGKNEIVPWTENYLNEIRPKIELAARLRKMAKDYHMKI